VVVEKSSAIMRRSNERREATPARSNDQTPARCWICAGAGGVAGADAFFGGSTGVDSTRQFSFTLVSSDDAVLFWR